MLDKSKVIKELNRVSDRLFVDFSHEAGFARMVWKKMADDPTFSYKVRKLSSQFLVPTWTGRLDDFFEVEQNLGCYRVLSVDGSQIYPDKHQGTNCSLINIGSVQLNYGVVERSVWFQSDPTVFVGDEDSQLNESVHELVNCRRQEFEFFAGLNHIKNLNYDDGVPFIFLFDGSLIFWHLESKDKEVKHRFLASYLDSLQNFYEKKTLIVGYISLTKSKELVNLVRIALTEFAHHFGFSDVSDETIEAIKKMVDSQIVKSFLKPFTRTTIFKNLSNITKLYPEHLHPHFFYMHVGNEIVRVEFPAWIAAKNNLIEDISRMVVDQAVKGAGYPVALAEAHEQAVVKSPDRNFFYHLVKRIGMTYKNKQITSQKTKNKRSIRI